MRCCVRDPPDPAGQAWLAAVHQLEARGWSDAIIRVRRDGDVCQITVDDSDAAQFLGGLGIPHLQVLVPAATAFFDRKGTSTQTDDLGMAPPPG